MDKVISSPFLTYWGGKTVVIQNAIAVDTRRHDIDIQSVFGRGIQLR